MGEWVRTTDGRPYKAIDACIDYYSRKERLLLMQIELWRDSHPEYKACLDDLEALVLR
jgi:hypothetical protein